MINLRPFTWVRSRAVSWGSVMGEVRVELVGTCLLLYIDLQKIQEGVLLLLFNSITLVTPLRHIYLSLNDSLLTLNTLKISKIGR